MQRWGDNYWETYSPVVNMMSVRLLLPIAKIRKLDSKAIDFVLVYPQAELDVDIWMYLTIGFQVDGQTEADSDRHYLLKLDRSLYGLKQGSFNWYQKLKTGLTGFRVSRSALELLLSSVNNLLYPTSYVGIDIVSRTILNTMYCTISNSTFDDESRSNTTRFRTETESNLPTAQDKSYTLQLMPASNRMPLVRRVSNRWMQAKNPGENHWIIG